jgi:LysR family transcriptional regulator for bpeEF and oprC
MSMDRFEAMRTFVQVLESGSYTRAARQRGLHKATASQQIRQLEDRLGVRLLTRTTRSVAPTEEGRAYYRHACTVLQEVDDMEAVLRGRVGTAEGHLRVNVPVAMGRLVFAPAVRDFLERHPRVSLELGCTDRTVDLVKEGVDCALRGGRLPDSGLSARRVGALQFVLCAAPRYIERHGLPDSPDDLVHHRQIGYVLASTGTLRPVSLLRDGHAVSHDVPARFVTTDSSAALSAALDGLGLFVVAGFVADHHLISGALVRVLPAWRCPALPLHWVTPTSRKRTARVQAFMDWAHTLLQRRLGSHLDP